MQSILRLVASALPRLWCSCCCLKVQDTLCTGSVRFIANAEKIALKLGIGEIHAKRLGALGKKCNKIWSTLRQHKLYTTKDGDEIERECLTYGREWDQVFSEKK